MSLYSPRASGLGNSAAYQVAGRPYLTGSTIPSDQVAKVTFPTVTRSFTVVNTGSADLRIYFVDPTTTPAADTGLHRFTLSNNSSFTMDVKCKEMYIKAVGESGFEMYAELTGIPATEMYELTGSGISVSTYTDGLN